MLQFSGWNLFGTLGALLSNHGVSLLLNLYFGPIANAVSMQVSNGLNQFVNSFQTAITPQITKLYASNKREELNNFLYHNTKYAFLLLWIMVLPIFLKLDYFLSVWLTEIPANTIIFTKLLMVYGLMYSYIRPMAIQATGRIKGIQLSAGILLILILPISWAFLENGYPIYSPLVVYVVFTFMFGTIFFKKINKFFSDKFSIIPLVVIISISLLSITYISQLMENNIYTVVSFLIISIFINLILIYYFGMDKNTRGKIKQLIAVKYKNFKGKK